MKPLNLIYSVILVGLMLFLWQCKNQAVQESPTIITVVKKDRKSTTALPFTADDPANNITSKEKINLGRLLFFDPLLSGDKDVACATCHHPTNAYAEYRDLSIGPNGKGLGSTRQFNTNNTIPIMKRNAHTILNTAFNGMDKVANYNPELGPMFWDNRVSSLETQALEPIQAFEEMRGASYSKDEILPEVIDRLKNVPEYVELFNEAFKEEDPINKVNLGKAIAAFERTLITPKSGFDQQMRGNMKAMSLSEKKGLQLFSQVGCINCHKGPMFSDYSMHIIGVPHNNKLEEFDKSVNEDYAFRTASLRNLQFTAPYMHNGKFNTLKEVLEFYKDMSTGKNFHSDLEREQLDPLVQALNLEVNDFDPLLSFLNSLNDGDFDKTIPSKVPSGLKVGGNIQ